MARPALWRYGLIIGSILAAILVAFFVYDLLEFQPHRQEIASLLEAGPPIRNSMLLVELQRADAAGRISLLATRSLLYEIDRNAPRLPTLSRIRREILWIQLLKIHYSEDELFLIERRLAFFDRKTSGYEAGARKLFGRSLDELSDLELAQLIVVARWPTRYRGGKDAGVVLRQARSLLARAVSRS